MPVSGASDNATVTRVTSSATSVALKAGGNGRRSLAVFNESTSILYVKHGGASASATDYTVQVAAGGYYEVPQPVFRGAVWGIWSAANGFAQVTEGY